MTTKKAMKQMSIYKNNKKRKCLETFQKHKQLTGQETYHNDIWILTSNVQHTTRAFAIGWLDSKFSAILQPAAAVPA